ncbi:peptidase T [Fructobacillus ficulneus]|uniref:Peptidase T n=1 Tax=Fructobacillus ficulneus TaxID=157463 RepID=A0A0K8MIL4_9LACO|nr:peptidase T [Fructobacillus ficulneus]
MIDMAGTPEEAKLTYIIRDHDHDAFENRKATMQQIADQLNKDLHKDRVDLEMFDQYYNMGDVIKDHQESVDLAEAVMTDLGIKPLVDPARGGTDGSKITFLGLPTPNLFAGGENMHGRFEYVSQQVMVQATDVLLGILEKAAQD